MRTFSLLSFAAAVSLCNPSPLSAQIISTMVPAQSVAPPAGGAGRTEGRPVAVHMMGGYTNWDFGFGDEPDFEARGGTESGGRNGFIGAGDLVVRASENVSVGGGGWFNKIANFVWNDPGVRGQFFPFQATRTLTMFSVYGNVFYKHIGVQAGFVPLRSEDTYVINNPARTTLSADQSQNDFDLYLVGRWGASGTTRARWSAMVGAGLYRYGSRPGDATVGIDPSPSSNAPFSGFANASIGIVQGLSVDASFWYTARDKNYSESDGRIGNVSQARLTVGTGYGW